MSYLELLFLSVSLKIRYFVWDSACNLLLWEENNVYMNQYSYDDDFFNAYF